MQMTWKYWAESKDVHNRLHYQPWLNSSESACDVLCYGLVTLKHAALHALSSVMVKHTTLISGLGTGNESSAA